MVKLLVALILIGFGSQAGADTIFLKDGRRIDTPGTWEENGQVRYFDQGRPGPAIPKADVLRIETDAAPTAGTAAQPTGAYDLQQRLARIKTHNSVEAARNATVAIETLTGHGSGFFISTDGFILTNRHVVEADATKLEQAKAELAARQKQLEALGQELEQLKRHLASMEKAVADDPKHYDHPSNRTVVADTRKNVQAGQQQYDRKRQDFEASQRHYRELAAKKAYQTGVKIFLIDGSQLKADVIRTSATQDLALLRLFDYRTPFVPLAKAATMAQGEKLFAIGNPMQFRHAVTDGVFSGVHQDMIMTSAPINPGNSGGPLVTAEGRVVGISTAKMIGQGIEGIGFAIPIQTALKEFADLLKDKVPPP